MTEHRLPPNPGEPERGMIPSRPQFPERPSRRGTGYEDPALLAGHSKATLRYLIALFLAALADLGQFLPVVERAQPELTNWQAGILVTGFIAMALFVTHMSGVLFREVKARNPIARRMAAYFCLMAWAGLGLTAFLVRLWVPQTAGSSPLLLDTTLTTDSDHDTAFASAVFFLALYLVTGVVAIIGAYLTHNPLRADARETLRARRKRTREAASSAASLALANEQMLAIGTQQAASLAIYEQALESRRAYGRQLKELAKLLVAIRAQDPVVTGSLFQNRPPTGP
ncbi:hypothetical protein [Acrocarpospora sp. B8E8]|uniref:hypothetical protein n=1 Tax=Acrocarpospora sp. B8E8 TaxID=3153572 RepID=UPI00325EE4D3